MSKNKNTFQDDLKEVQEEERIRLSDAKVTPGKNNGNYRTQLSEAITEYERRIRDLKNNIAELNKTRNNLKTDLMSKLEIIENQRETIKTEIAAREILEDKNALFRNKIHRMRNFEFYRGTCYFLVIVIMLSIIASI